MSDILVGNEELPNVYIKRIEVFDGVGTKVNIKVSLCVIDRLENGEGMWSTDERIINSMKLMFAASSVDAVNNSIINGTVEFSERGIKGIIPTDELVTMHMESTPLSANIVKVPMDSYHYYVMSYSFEHDTANPNLKVFAAVSMKNAEIPLAAPLYGPVSSESIYQDNSLQNTTTVLLSPEGTQYNGPVHQHDGVIMAGSYHSSRPHPVLTAEEIQNLKIKDYRKLSPPTNFSPKEISRASFSDLFDSVTTTGYTTGMFGLDVTSTLVNKTKYGRKILDLNPLVLSILESRFVVSGINVIRERIKPSYGSNSIGGSDFSKREAMETISIIRSYEREGSLFPATKLEDLNKMEHVVELEALPTLSDDQIRIESQIYTNDLKDYKLISAIKEIYLINDKSIRFFEFEDRRLNDSRIGYYKYKVEIEFKDPTISFITELYQDIVTTLREVKEYQNSLMLNKNYNYDLDSTKEQFYLFQDELHFRNYSNAPWVKGPDIVSKMFSYLYNYSTEELTNLSILFFSYLDPKNATVKSVNHFLEIFNTTVKKMFRVFDFKPETIKENQLKVFPKNTPRSTNVRIEKEFNKIFSPFENRKRYDFLGQTNRGGVLKITEEVLSSRFQYEKSRFFNSAPEQYTDPSLNLPEYSGLTDTSGVASGYISAMTIVDKTKLGKGTTVNLADPRLFSDKEKTNQIQKIFDNIEYKKPNQDTQATSNNKFNFNTKVSRAFNSYSYVAPGSQEAEEFDTVLENLIESEEYLGINSSFSIYSEDLRESLQPPKLDTENFIEPLQGQINNPAINTPMTSEGFSLSNSNIVTSLASFTPPSLLQNTMNNLPNQVTSIFLANSEVSKMEPDLVFAKDRNLITKILNFTLVKVQVLAGFQKFKNSDEMDLRRPIWRMLNPDTLTENRQKLFCRLVYYTDKRFGIGVDENVMIPFANKYFFITSEDLYNFIPTSPVQSNDLDTLQTIYLQTSDYNMDYCTTDLVTQANDFFQNAEFSSEPITSQPTVSFGSAPQVATTGGSAVSTATPSSTISGGSY